MSAHLTVEAVTVQRFDADRSSAPNIDDSSTEHLVAITVANVSDPAATVRVVSRATHVSYDRDRRTLLLGFEAAADIDSPGSCPSHPAPHKEIPAGELVTIEDHIVSPFLTGDDPTYAITVTVETDIDRIECVVAYTADSPPSAIDLTSSVPMPEVKYQRARGRWMRDG
jgi:hypothetical protein